MRIVDVCAFYTPAGGGVKTYIDRKLAAGPRLGHEIIVLAPGTEARVEEHGPDARIIYLAEPKLIFDRNYHYFGDEDALGRALDDLRPDFVECSSPWRSARFVGEWPGAAPRALVMHADPLSAYAYRWFGPVASRETIDRSFDWYWRHLLRLDSLYDATVVSGDSLGDRLRDGGMTRVMTQPMGVADAIFSPRLRDEALRARLLARCDLPPDATLLVAAGRHAAEKRWPMVIEAVTAAGAKRPVGLVLAGAGRQSARVARAAEDNPHIHLAAPITDRLDFARFLASGDALIHGCEAETFCMVAAEARASGLPLIVPAEGGAADRARGTAGLTYPPADTIRAAAAIGLFIDSRDDRRARAVADAGSVRTMEQHFAELFEAYQGIVDARRPSPQSPLSTGAGPPILL